MSCRPVRVAVVHVALTGHCWQVWRWNRVTITSAPRWMAGAHDVLVFPWGQVTCCWSQSTVKAVRSKPAAARAWGEVSASIGVISATPNRAMLETSRSAEG